MALFTKENPIGLDARIQGLAKRLFGLGITWGSVETPIDLDGFCRLYVINREGKKTIERFKNKTDYFNECVANKTKFFFIHRKPEIPSDIINFTTSVELFFIVDLNVVKPGNDTRNDMEVKNDIMQVVKTTSNFRIERVETDPDAIMGEFEYEPAKMMQPWFVCKLTLGVEYAMEDNCHCCD